MQDRTSPTRRSLLATHGRTIHRVIRDEVVGAHTTVHVRFALKADKEAGIALSPLSADFVAEVAEQESGRWRRAINLACPSPVRAVPGDSPNDCQRDFGMT